MTESVATTSKYWDNAQFVINGIDEIPRDEKLHKTEERCRQYITTEINEIIKVMSVVGRDKIVEDAIMEALDKCPKVIRNNFIASLFQIFNKIKKQRKHNYSK